MGSGSLLRVLIAGNNPNLMLYTSRFQLAKSVELFHVSDKKSSTFVIDTMAYGKDEYQLESHFTSISNLIEAFRQSSEHTSLIFDMIILSASSLQEVSSLASQLNPLININTKLFLESSGFVQLEPFVKMSLDLPQLNIFSIATDYDIRQVGDNQYKQFGARKEGGSVIFLGESSLVKQNQQQQQNSKTSPANSSSSLSQTATKYPKNVSTLLDTFQRLFKKLLPQDTISVCNYSAAEFVSQQWALAIPRVCFDPLLILLEETKPAELHQQILAKPLISGLVTEVITVMKSMGARLNGNMENESGLLSHWQKMYTKADEMPALVYHYISRTASLNIDMLLLQPILLADDYGIKTPYLEFLYSLMCQYQKLNEGKSKWFARIEDQQDLRTKLIRMTEERNQLKTRVSGYDEAIQEKDSLIQQLSSTEQSSRNQVLALQNQIGALRQEIIGQTKKHDMEMHQLREEQRGAATNDIHANPSPGTPQREQHDFNGRDLYAPTGTPNLKDIEDMALYGVNYGDSPQREQSKQRLQQPTPPPTSGSTHSSGSHSGSGSGSGSGYEGDKSLRERELEIRKKELDLQERELEFQRRAVQQQQRFNKNQKPNNNATSPTLGNRKPSFPHLQQMPNVRSNRSMHGAAPTPTASAGNFVDPIAGSVGYRSSGAFNNQPAPSGMSQSQPHHAHSIKPTSRKNRNSNMAIIGNASSLGLSSYGRPPASSQTRLNSLSTGNLNTQPRLRQQSTAELNNGFNNAYGASNNWNTKLNMPNPVKSNSFPLNVQAVSGNGSQQPLEFQAQRQFSSSTTMENKAGGADLSMSSVVHNPMNEQTNVRQPEVSTQPISPPQINVDGPETSSASSGGAPVCELTDEGGDSTEGSNQINADDKKDKKKKFGLFGKKNKSKKTK